MTDYKQYYAPGFVKSIGEPDKDGNYIIEVEASNENFDLQEQNILQQALLDSKDYFMTNGIISDDHLHKRVKSDGTVETDKTKIIGEPLDVFTDGKKTYIRAKIFGAIEAAKPYINLLKAGAKVIHASVGGIFPKVSQNTDGTETISKFLWNDVALTVSPVNPTVGSARFAKSFEFFEKALEAGYGTDASTMTGGRVLQEEDVEEDIIPVMDVKLEPGMSLFDEETDEEKETVKKSNEDTNLAIVSAVEEIKQGVSIMSSLTDTINGILEKSNAKKCVKKAEKEDEDLFNEDEMIEKDEDEEPETEDEEEVKKSEFVDATDFVQDLVKSLDDTKAENERLHARLDDIEFSMKAIAKSMAELGNTPNERVSVVEKSISVQANPQQEVKKMTQRDFEVAKSALVAAARKGSISLDAVTFYSSELQKSLAGQKISQDTWNEVCSIVKENK